MRIPWKWVHNVAHWLWIGLLFLIFGMDGFSDWHLWALLLLTGIMVESEGQKVKT